MTGEISLCKLRITLKNGETERTALLLQVMASEVLRLRVTKLKIVGGKACLIETFSVAVAVPESDADFLLRNAPLAAPCLSRNSHSSQLFGSLLIEYVLS